MSKEEKLKINFKGKEMNLWQAKLYTYELMFGLRKAHLTNEEEDVYRRWKYLGKGKNQVDASPEGYLVKIINQTIKNEKINYCKNHGGHIEKKGSAYTIPGSNVTHYTCGRCGSVYERTFNPFSG